MSLINETVNVNAFYFAGRQGNLETFPRQIEFDSTQLTLKDGLQYLVQKGHDVVRLFDMTDGEQVYRLRYENETWTLIGRK